MPAPCLACQLRRGIARARGELHDGLYPVHFQQREGIPVRQQLPRPCLQHRRAIGRQAQQLPIRRTVELPLRGEGPLLHAGAAFRGRIKAVQPPLVGRMIQHRQYIGFDALHQQTVAKGGNAFDLAEEGRIQPRPRVRAVRVPLFQRRGGQTEIALVPAQAVDLSADLRQPGAAGASLRAEAAAHLRARGVRAALLHAAGQQQHQHHTQESPAPAFHSRPPPNSRFTINIAYFSANINHFKKIYNSPCQTKRPAPESREPCPERMLIRPRKRRPGRNSPRP